MTTSAAGPASRTIPAMQDDRAGRRDLALAAVTIVGLSRLIEPPGVWFVAAFLLGAVILGSLQVLHDETVDAADHALGIPIESLILPAVAAVACLGAIRLVPFGLALVPALMITAFLAFVGVAATVPGGLAQPGTSGIAGQPLPRRDLLVLATGDAIVAFLLGYRAAALRVTTLRDALWSAATYGIAIAIAAAALRFVQIPRLMGPALLTLTFYLWDAFHAAGPSRRRDVRWIWQTALLAVLGVAVIALNLLIRE